MATKKLKNIFLSASIPLKQRHQKYFETADVIAIRDAVIALSTVTLPNHRIIWGGHPSVTPIIYHVIERLGLSVQEHVWLYQSKFFEKDFPEDNNKFENVFLTQNTGEIKSSIYEMRIRMLTDNEFVAGIFIGGMDGIEDEFKLFREFHSNAIFLPIKSTGAGAKIVYDEFLPKEKKNLRLENDYAYMSLFQDLLIDKI